MSDINLTEKETIALRCMKNNDFQDSSALDSQLWYDCLMDDWTHDGLAKSSHSGVMNSLLKKGLVECNYHFDPGTIHDDDSTIWLTPAGIEAARDL